MCWQGHFCVIRNTVFYLCQLYVCVGCCLLLGGINWIYMLNAFAGWYGCTGMVWYGAAGMVWFGMFVLVWYGMVVLVWYGMVVLVWYGMVVLVCYANCSTNLWNIP